MGLIARWQGISTAENDRIEAALLEYLDEDDALSALQVMMQHTVPASTYRGAVASIDLLRGTLAVAAKALDSAGDPHTAERVRAALLATSEGQ